MNDFAFNALKNDSTGIFVANVIGLMNEAGFDIEGLSLEEYEYEFGVAPDMNMKHIKYRHRGYELPGLMESDGTERYLGLCVLLAFLQEEPRFVSIDEVETSLHFELVSNYVRTFLDTCGNGSQMLIATHDINLLSEKFIRRDVFWFMERDSDDGSRIVRLTDARLHKNISPFNAYRQGRIIGLPISVDNEREVGHVER